MPIEFRCTKCQKLLRVPDETAGRQAKCPSCSTVLTIPSATTNAPPPAPPAAPRSANNAANPYEAPSLTGTRLEHTSSEGEPFPPTTIEPFAVISRAWEIFKLKMGFTILVVVIGFGLQYAVNFGLAFGNIFLRAALPGSAVYAITEILYQIVANLFGSWLWFGIIATLLKMSRGEPTSLGDVFSGGRYLLRAVIATILLWLAMLVIMGPLLAPGGLLLATRGANDPVATIALGLGMLVAMIPVLYVWASILQYPYLIVDRDMDAISALSLSWKMTAGNRWRLMVVYFLAGLIAMGGIVACCLPALITVPLAALTSVVAYLSLTGQSSIESFSRESNPPAA